ncbi:MAG: formylglycine-generating enzyme family protein [Gemmataceae bacterium]|nr:formylglycine-generating enzyme family protein [Gemmataceae bacterium]
MDSTTEIEHLLNDIPRNPAAAFQLATQLMKLGDIRGEILLLSYTLLGQDAVDPKRLENERRLQRLLASGITPLVPCFTNCLGITFNFIPLARALSGSQFDKPRGPLPTRAFYMSNTPITQAQWKRLMPVNPSYFENDDNPVEGVLWADCVEYCRRLSEITGQKVRLPTSTEWEYACRAGTSSEYYSGNGENALASVGWYEGNSGGEPHPVAQKLPNAWGLYDMHGNVFEWCDTACLSADEYAGRVICGGAWGSRASDCTALSYRCYPEDSSNFTIGFRVSFSFVNTES